MKKSLLMTVLLLILVLMPSAAFAQGMMGNWTSSPSSTASDNHTVREEAAGKEIWDKLQAKQLECKNLTDDNYGSLGEYFMGQMMGSSHEAMNTTMERMMGKEGEEQMHIAMGKRMSGCEPNAPMPQTMMSGGMMPMMMGMMGGGGNPMMDNGGWNNMMGGWNGFGFLGWLPMLLFWILLILGAVALLRYIGRSGQQQENKTPMEILKDRYAKGEINKKDFEQMKKDVG